MSVVADRSDKIVVTVTPAQARHIATAIRLDLAARWEQEWLHPQAPREEINSARSLLDVCADELEMLRWGEPAGDVALRSERRRLGELAQNLLDGGEECFACRDDTPAVRRQGEDMLAAALVILGALSDA
jgi:hypothetical protein